MLGVDGPEANTCDHEPTYEGRANRGWGEFDQRTRTHSIKNRLHCVYQWRRKGGSEREKGGAKEKEKKYDMKGGRTCINKQARLHHIDYVFSQELILFVHE